MPYHDGTGPTSTGPIGRRLGPCGQGLRRGSRLLNYDYRCLNQTPQNRLMALDEEEKILEKELTIIRSEKKALQDQK